MAPSSWWFFDVVFEWHSGGSARESTEIRAVLLINNQIQQVLSLEIFQMLI